MKFLPALILVLLTSGCAAPAIPTPNILPLPTPVPNPSPNPVIITPQVQSIRIALGNDREMAEALRGVSAGFADCLRRDTSKVKNTEQLRAAWSEQALSFQFEGTPLFKRSPGLGAAVDAVIIEAMGGLESKPLTEDLRAKAVAAFDSISAVCKGI